MPVQSLADASQALYMEIGVVQNMKTGKLSAILGTSPTATVFRLKRNEVIVSHVHPSWAADAREVEGDINHAKYLESVIDWSGNLLYYDGGGVIENPGCPS